ncbi:MAG: hypothetical protein ACTSRD_15640, partial [Promethearchaeota archaeon]
FTLYLIRFFPMYYQHKSDAINKILPLIQNCIDLYMSFLPGSQDLSVIIVNFLANVPSPIQKSFKHIQQKVQNGFLPEDLLRTYISPSPLFDSYLKTLIQHNFSKSKMTLQTETPLENKYSAKSRSLESRISISFFFGIFIPLGFSLGVFLQKINGILLLFSSPILFILLYYLTKQMVKDNSLLLGTLTNKNKEIKTEYSEYWTFFYNLASNLTLMGPEHAVVHALESTSLPKITAISSLLGNLKAHSLSLDEFMESLHHNIQGSRTQMIFGTLKYMLSSSSMISSKNILKLLTLLKHHQRLETQRLITVKGEIFKVRIFQILLPIILALLTSIFLLISSIIPNTSYLFTISLTLGDMTLFFINQLISVNISIFFFRRTVGLKNSIFSVLAHTFLFLVVFLLSFFMLQAVSITF